MNVRTRVALLDAVNRVQHHARGVPLRQHGAQPSLLKIVRDEPIGKQRDARTTQRQIMDGVGGVAAKRRRWLQAHFALGADQRPAVERADHVHERVVLGQRFGALGLAATLQVRRRGDERAPIRQQRMRDQVGALWRRDADAQRDVDAFEREIEHAILEPQLDAQARMLRHQRMHVRDHTHQTKRHRRRYQQRTFERVADAGARVLDLAQDA